MTVSLIDYSKDATYRFDYGRTVNKTRFPIKQIGTELTLLKKYSPTVNVGHIIYCNTYNGNDSSPGDGTLDHPYKTVSKSISMCTANEPYVHVSAAEGNTIIQSNELTITNTYFEGLLSPEGEDYYITFRTLDYTPSNSNTIYVKKTGSDSNAGTLAAPCLTLTGATGAISKVTSSKQTILILDSGTYDETAFKMTGYFTELTADYGCNPTITINQNINTDYTNYTQAVNSIDDTGTCTYPMMARFADDSYVVAWIIGGNGYFCLAHNNDYLYFTKTMFMPNITAIYAVFVLPVSENIVFLAKGSDTYLYFAIFSKAGASVKSSTYFLGPTGAGVVSTAAHGAAMSDDKWCACWCDSAISYNYYFAKYDETGAAVIATTTIDSGDSTYQGINVAIQSNDNMIFDYIKTNNGDPTLFMFIYNQDGATIKGSMNLHAVITNTSAGNTCVGRNSTIVNIDDSFVIFYQTANYYSAIIIDYNYNIAKTINEFAHDSGDYSRTYYISYFRLNNGDIGYMRTGATTEATYLGIFNNEMDVVFKENAVIGYKFPILSAFINTRGDILLSVTGTSSHVFQWRISDYYFVGVLVSTVSIIDGITFDCENQSYLKYLFTGASNLARRWCEIKNQSSTYYDNYPTLVGDSTLMAPCITYFPSSSLDRRKEYIHDCNNGDIIVNVVAKFYNNIFLNCLGVDAFVTGTAATIDYITYQNNSVQSAGGGFYLTGNGGTNETCKNNIFNDISGYDISAAVEITAYNCISTGIVNNVILSACSALNPLFLNTGKLGSLLADLELMSTVMGDYASSPGLLMGTDGKDVGAYDTMIIGPADSYTTLTITKQVDGIERQIKFAGSTKIPMDTGDWTSSFQGASEIITKTQTMLNAEFLG